MNWTDRNDEKNEKNETNPAGQNAPSQNAQKQDAQEREFEAMLARALRRMDAPEGFAARVTALAEAQERTERAAASMTSGPTATKKHWWRMSSLGWKPVWGTAAAILVAGVLGGHAVHEHRLDQERARMQASRDFDASVQITDRVLEHAREQLKRSGVQFDGSD